MRLRRRAGPRSPSPKRAGALGSIGFLVALLIAAPPSAHAADSLAPLWDDAWRAGHAGPEQLWDPAATWGSIPGVSAEDAAVIFGEVALRRMHEETLSIGRPDRAIARLRAFLDSSPPPVLEGMARHLLGIFSHVAGDPAAANEEWDRLGFLSDFQIIGPFENERGSGFTANYEPERTVDLSAELPGKRGNIRWRRWSERGIAGQVELAELIRPSEESLAYLVTWIEVPETTDAVLRVGSSGAYRIWIDDTEVMALDVDRPIRLDQEAIPVRLSAGWHRLRILSGQTKGRWAFRIRVTDDAGAAIPTLRTTGERPPGFTASSDDPRRDAFVDTGALSRLNGAPDSLEACLLRGWLAQEVHAHDRNDHPDRDQFRRALELKGDDPLAHYMLATSFEQTVDHAAEREENPRREALEKTLALDATFDRARFDLIEYTRARFGNDDRAKTLLAPALTRDNPSPAALELARRLETSEVGSALAARWQHALEKELANELRLPVRLRAMERAQQRGQRDEMLRLLAEGRAFSPFEPSLLNREVRLAVEKGDFASARAILEGSADSRPLATRGWVRLAAFERSVDEGERALAAIDRALRIAPQAESLHVERGHLLHSLGRETAALAAWGEALTLEPNQPRLRALTEYLQSSEPGLEAEFRLDLTDRIAAALSSPPGGEDAYHILLDHQVSDVQEDGTAIRYRQQLLAVQTEAGVRQLDFHSVPYAHGEQWVRVLRARVHKRDGSYSDARIRNRDPEVRAGEYPVWSQAFVDLPPLEPGDVIELETLKEDLKQSFFGDYFGETTLFGGLLPRTETRYTVRFPSDRTLYHREDGLGAPEITEAEGRTTWAWRTMNGPKIEPEPAGPPIQELVPRVEVSSYENWDEFAQWYHHLIRRQFESSPEIRAKVAELTEGLTTPEEKVRVIYEFVANEIRYIAWEFGVHGFLPYNATTIFTRRFGDCKDKSTLICTMLEEVGIEAWPVLINGTRTRPEEDLSLPMISHFNHCIAYVPSVHGGLFIDGTAENHGVRELPGMDYGAEIVVVKDDGAERHQIPWNTPEQFAINEQAQVSIDETGNAEISQSNRFTGDFAVMIRDRFEIESKREEQIERILGGRYPGLEVRTVETSDLDDLTIPVELKLELTVPRFADLGSGSIELPPIRDLLQSLRGVGDAASRPERNDDLLLGNPRAGDLRVEIELPKGVRVASLPKSETFGDDRIQCEFQFTQENGRIVIQRSYSMLTPRISPEHYESFKRIVDRVAAKLEERVILAPGSEVD